MPTARPSNYNHIKRNDFHPFRDASLIRQVADRTFNVRYISPKDYVVGQVFYVYPTVRLECGIIVDSSSDITFKNVKQRFNYSLALVAQNSENITLEDSDFSPGDTEVDFTSFADFMQFSMCRGRIAVRNCNFDAAGDDTCNVHGFHFKILEADRNRLVVGFGHNQSYGFECIRPGDVIAYVNPETLLEEGRAIVSQARLIDKYRYELTVSSYECPVGVGGVIENVSANPSFEFSGNVINRIVTRGLLVTTRGKVVIENNRFLNTGASGILISDDANNWYESGCCLDVTIRGNAFMNCEENAILIKPEIKKYAGPVHRNILIENNLFVLNNIHALNVSDSSDIVMKGNVYKGIPKDNKWIVAKNIRNIVTDCPE